MKEMFPYVDNRGNLFFASEGHKGYGMLDMYLADRKGGGYNILNLGPQLNSKFDDFGLSIDNEYKYALFSSNRNGGKGSDDIYYAALDKNVLSGTGDDNVLSGTVDDNVLSGTVVSSINKKPLKDAIVYVYKGNELIEELHTSGNGYFEFNTSHPGTFNVTAHKVFYKKNSVEIEVGKSRSNSKVNVPLTPVFIVKGKVTDIDSRLLVPQTIVSLVCDDAVIQYVKADNDGDYRIEISPDKEYSFEFIRFGYISFRKEVSTEGKLPGILNLDIELKSVENRDMFVLEGVYYDYNGWNIREDARPVLHRLVELMKQNPQLKVELSSHSDSRGSNEYNLILSQRRAEAIIEFLWMKGIPNSRVSIIANGEKYLIFRTGDEDLSEDKHQANRRTEIRLYF
jgi:outer membrane protein OmpA-like peptidoglycan-associated protein